MDVTWPPTNHAPRNKKNIQLYRLQSLSKQIGGRDRATWKACRMNEQGQAEIKAQQGVMFDQERAS
jgi:hypothetical protein